jgi:creatinine amidohydrolase/Fe(II)-dependent formamide hydrolase-like protein
MTQDSDHINLLRWETLSKRRFDQLDRAQTVVIVTCSPLEVHGPHLPLGADALEGEGLVERIIPKLPERHRARTFVKLPFIYTATDTVPQPGSLFFRPSTTIAVLEDLGRSLAAQGFRDILVSNFHGSPRHFLAIETACDRVSRERGVRMVSVFSVMLTRLTDGSSELDNVFGAIPGVKREDLVGDTHGGLVETSQLLALHPEWIERDYARLPRRTVDLWLAEHGVTPEAGKPDHRRGILGMIREIKSGLGFFREETYSGAPGAASPELGEQFLDTLAAHSAPVVAEILDGKLPPERCHSPLWPRRFMFVNPWMVRVFNRILGIPTGIG